MTQPPDLMKLNVASPQLRQKPRLLIASRCIAQDKPWLLQPLADKYTIVTACPEEHHINQLGFKLLGVLARTKYEEVAVLTTDGSMHCIQLHYMLEELAKTINFNRRHMVVEHNKIREITPQAVKTSRYLARVQRLLERREQPQHPAKPQQT